MFGSEANTNLERHQKSLGWRGSRLVLCDPGSEIQGKGLRSPAGRWAQDV